LVIGSTVFERRYVTVAAAATSTIDDDDDDDDDDSGEGVTSTFHRCLCHARNGFLHHEPTILIHCTVK